MNSLIQESFLDGGEQVISKDTQKDVRLGTTLQVMEKSGRSMRGLFMERNAASTRVRSM